MTSTQRATGPLHATTILAVRQGGTVAMAGDGQVTVGEMVMKHHARKIRRLLDGRVLAGFAGSTADALTLFDKFESNLDRYGGNLRRAAVELTKEWRTDKFLRRLEAMLLVADRDQLLVLTGDGDVIEPDDGVAAIGSGGSYAQAAARALVRHTDLSAAQIARAAMEIAAAMCIYTNDALVLFTLDDAAPASGPDADGSQPAAAGQDAGARAAAQRAAARRGEEQRPGVSAETQPARERADARRPHAERAGATADVARTGAERAGSAADADATAASGAGT